MLQVPLASEDPSLLEDWNEPPTPSWDRFGREEKHLECSPLAASLFYFQPVERWDWVESLWGFFFFWFILFFVVFPVNILFFHFIFV